MKISKCVLSGIAALVASSTSSAGIVVEATAGPITHAFESNYTIEYLLGSSFGAVNWPAFTTSLSNSSSITFKLSAPTGQHFQVDERAPTFYRFLSAASSAWTAPGATGIGLGTYLPGQISFEQFRGPAPARSDVYARLSTDRKSLQLSATTVWNGSGSLSFNSVKFTIDLSDIEGETIPTYTYLANNFGPTFLNFFNPGPGFDPGPSIRLVSSVPEPATLFLFGVGGLAVACLGRRKLTRAV